MKANEAIGVIESRIDPNDQEAVEAIRVLREAVLDPSIVRRCFESLTLAERASAIEIARSIKGRSGALLASDISEKTGFSRTSVATALKKLHAGGILTSRSMGPNGTYVTFTNASFKNILASF